MSGNFFKQDTYALVKKEHVTDVCKMLTLCIPIMSQDVRHEGAAWGKILSGKHFDFDSPQDELEAVLKYEVIVFKNGFSDVAQHLKDTNKQIKMSIHSNW